MSEALHDLAASVAAATGPEDLFGDATLDEIRAIWRKFAAILHPDRYAGPDQTKAHAAFVRAAALKDEAERRLLGIPIVSRKATYRVEPVFARGDLAELRACTAAHSAERAVLKIVAKPNDNDLAENEAETLGRLFPTSATEEKFLRYLPRLHDTFHVRDDAGVQRRANVVAGFFEHVSLAEIRAARPHGLDFRDVAWMTKRLLTVLGFVHRRGVVHGAVLPPHLLVHPIDHGARLVDWCYARDAGRPLRAIVGSYRAFYPPEVFAKKPATPATDIFMAAKTALALLDDKTPAPIRTFWTTCLAPAPTKRPDDAWALHDELDALLRRLVGKPTYRPLAMPART